MRALLIAAALVLAPSIASAEEHPRTWRVEATVRHVILGNRNPTGGIAPQLAGSHAWPLSSSFEVDAGVEALAFGFSSARWMGVLVGPHGGVAFRAAALRLDLDVGLDVGRIPVCNDWPDGALCVRFWGIFPRTSIGASYDVTPGLAAVASFSARFVRTLAWSGVSWEPSLGARASW